MSSRASCDAGLWDSFGVEALVDTIRHVLVGRASLLLLKYGRDRLELGRNFIVNFNFFMYNPCALLKRVSKCRIKTWLPINLRIPWRYSCRSSYRVTPRLHIGAVSQERDIAWDAFLERTRPADCVFKHLHRIFLASLGLDLIPFGNDTYVPWVCQVLT